MFSGRLSGGHWRRDGDTPLALYERELDYIFASLRRLGAAPDDTAELAQAVFLLLRRTWPRRQLSCASRPHLFGLAFRVMRVHRKRARQLPTAGAEPLLLNAELERMPLLRRAAVIMHDLDGFSVPEIALVLSITCWGARVRLRRAHKAIAAAMRRMTAEAAWALSGTGA